VAGRVCECETGAPREVLDTALALTEMLQKLQTVRMAQRLRNPGKACKYRLFGSDT
jgi:hypothetical protein